MNPTEQCETPGAEVAIDFRPIPSGIAKLMRTREFPPAGRTDGTLDVATLGKRATRVLAEIKDALHDPLDAGGGLTALGVCEERNALTGAEGLILRRLMRQGSYSAPLAEMLSESGRLDLRGKQRFDAFRSDAYRYGLGLWIHPAVVGERHTAFAIAREGADSKKLWYLARLLVAPFEIGQWHSPFLETGGDGPS